MSKSILDIIHCSYKTSVLQCSRTHENANNRQYVSSVENLFSQILWESTRWHSLVIFLSYLKKLGTYINPGRRKVNCECREVPLSLGAVQHI